MKPTGPHQLSAREALECLLSAQRHAIDVRSEKEFNTGHLPHFLSAPILNNEERHQVGLTYRKSGQEAAIRLGVELTAPFREARVKNWVDQSQGKDLLLACWRGGLRSKTALKWIVDSGFTGQVATVQGGYKAMRRLLLEEWTKPQVLMVLSGKTGSGKTKLLRQLTVPKLDLEARANHRGSSFGRPLDLWQPSQATFENAVGLELYSFRGAELVVEDESSAIGSVRLVKPFKDRMKVAPVIVLEVTSDERISNLFEEYVEAPLRAGVQPLDLQAIHLEALKRIEKKLGIARAGEVAGLIQRSRMKPDIASHRDWIWALLVSYYDGLYEFAFNRQKRPILFRGDYQQCLNLLRQ